MSSHFFHGWGQDPVKRGASLFAFFFHAFLLGLACFSSSQKPPEKKKLLVLDKKFSPPVTRRISTSSPSRIQSAATPPPMKASTHKPVAKKEQPKKEEKKPLPPSSKKKQKPTLVQSQKPILQQHVKELEERIAKIEAKHDRMATKTTLAVPQAVLLSTNTSALTKAPSSAFFSSLETSEADDVSLLVGYLQSSLQLPDVGEVQIELRLRTDGSVEAMKVVKADSIRNKKYLEEELMKLSFPPLSSRSFLFTFCNRI